MHVIPFVGCVERTSVGTSYNFAVCHNQSCTTGLNILRRKCGMEAFIVRPGTMHSWAILEYGIKLQLKNFLFGREKKNYCKHFTSSFKVWCWCTSTMSETKKRNFSTHENQYEEYKRCTTRIFSQLSSFDVDKVEIEKAHIPELQFEVCTILIAESSGMRVLTVEWSFCAKIICIHRNANLAMTFDAGHYRSSGHKGELK